MRTAAQNAARKQARQQSYEARRLATERMYERRRADSLRWNNEGLLVALGAVALAQHREWKPQCECEEEEEP